jgi:hypothetical protein
VLIPPCKLKATLYVGLASGYNAAFLVRTRISRVASIHSGTEWADSGKIGIRKDGGKVGRCEREPGGNCSALVLPAKILKVQAEIK